MTVTFGPKDRAGPNLDRVKFSGPILDRVGPHQTKHFYTILSSCTQLNTLAQHFIPILYLYRIYISLEYPVVFSPVKYFGPLGPILDRVGPRQAKHFYTMLSS